MIIAIFIPLWVLSLAVVARVAYKRGGRNEAETYLATIRQDALRKPEPRTNIRSARRDGTAR